MANGQPEPDVIVEWGFVYVQRAFDAFVSLRVAKSLFKAGKGFAQMARDSRLDGIVYAAFAAESYINKIGRMAYEPDEFPEMGFKNMKCKWKAVYRKAFDEDLNAGQGFYQNVSKLFAARDSLVHDKPFHLKDAQTLAEFEKRSQEIEVTQEEACEILLSVDREFSKFRYRGNPIPFVSQLRKYQWAAWKAPERLLIEPPLPFSGAMFPNEHEYALFYRKQLGVDPPPLRADAANKTIGATRTLP